MATALEKELFSYIIQLNDIQKRSVLQMLKTFMQGHEQMSPPISIEQYNKEIEDAIARVESGEYYTQEDVERMSREW